MGRRRGGRSRRHAARPRSPGAVSATAATSASSTSTSASASTATATATATATRRGAPGSEVRSLGYHASLDGMRGLGVISIMLAHAGVAGFQGAVLGVDIFFVLSGFLITYLLILELRRTGSINRGAFWTRRARRLLPALFALLLAVGLYSALFATGAERDTIRGDGLASLLYVQNWRLIFSNQSYFAQFGVPSPLRHLWTLAVEEQWYVIWPILFLALVRAFKGNLAKVAAVAVALTVASAIWMIVLFHPGDDPSRVYYGTDTRLQTLLIGALLAFLLSWRRELTARWARVALQVAGAASLAALIFCMKVSTDRSAWLYQGGFTLVAVLSAVLIAAALHSGPSRALLSIKPLPWVGLISYGLYLWHWPIYVWLTPARTGLHDSGLMAVRFAVTFAVATVSYYALEQPVRTGRWRWSAHPLRWAPAAAVVVAFCLLVTTTDLVAVQGRTEAGAAAQQAEAAAADPSVTNDAFAGPAPPGATKVLVAGDSVAFTISFYPMPPVEQGKLWLHSAAIPGCGIQIGDGISDGVRIPQSSLCTAWSQRYAAGVAESDPDVSVLLIGAWELYDRVVDGHRIHFKTPEMEANLRTQLDRAHAILTANGAPMVLLTAPCFSPEALALNMWGEKERTEAWRVHWLNGVFSRWAADHPADVTLLDIQRRVCPGGKYASSMGGHEIRYDGVHFTQAGAQYVWTWLGPQLQAIAARHRAGVATPATTPAAG